MSTVPPPGFEGWSQERKNKFIVEQYDRMPPEFKSGSCKKNIDPLDQAEVLSTDGSSEPRVAIEIKPGDLPRMVSEAEGAIAARNMLFQRGNKLVRPGLVPVEFSDGAADVAPGIHDQSIAGIHGILGEVADWQKWSVREKRFVSRDVPENVSRVIHARAGQWPFSRLVGVLSCPTLRRDGSVLDAHGYDAASGFYNFWRGGALKIDPAPSRSAAEEALEDLQHLLQGFSFVDDVDRSVALSVLMTPVARGAMDVAPLHMVTAPTAGTGKSYLVDCAAMITTGRRCPVQSASDDESETEKRLIGALLAGSQIINLDNVNREISLDILCQAVERPLITLRPLGSSSVVEIENRFCMFSTGNGLRASGDLMRRTLICRLDARMERPETREFDFNPIETVARDRPRYIMAVLTIIRAFLLSGERQDLLPLASFDDYTRTVRGALVWLGCPDPALSIEMSRENDSELRVAKSIIAFLQKVFGPTPFSVRDVIDTIVRRDDSSSLWGASSALTDKDRDEFREQLLVLAGVRGSVSGKRLSRWLTKNLRRRVASAWIEEARQDAHFETLRWRIVTT